MKGRVGALLVGCVMLGACSAPAGRTSTTSATSSASTAPSGTSSPAAAPITVALEPVDGALTAPIAMVSPPGESDVTYVVDQGGVVLPVTADGVDETTPFLDITKELVELSRSQDDERGLLGMVFSPDYAQDRAVYVFRTVPSAKDEYSHVNVLSRFRTVPDGKQIDLTTEEEIWRLEQVEASHAAGQLAFDDRGRLLVFLGDAQDPEQAQDPDSPFGKVLAIDLDRPRAGPEVLASGMRHPWRVTRDPATQQLLFADPNFTSQFQEVNTFGTGANYGWAAHPPTLTPCWRDAGTSVAPKCSADPHGAPLTPPLAEYGPFDGLIVSGVQVYRGASIPQLTGRLLVSEWGVGSTGVAGAGTLLASAEAIGEHAPYPAPVKLVALEIADPQPHALFWSLMADASGELFVGAMASRAPVAGSGDLYRVVRPS